MIHAIQFIYKQMNIVNRYYCDLLFVELFELMQYVPDFPVQLLWSIVHHGHHSSCKDIVHFVLKVRERVNRW